MSSQNLLLFLPIFMAKMYIELTGTFHETNPNLKLYLTGMDIAPISNEEIMYFNLTEENLKAAVKEYFGMEPSEVFIKSPLRRADLHETLRWQPILRVLAPQNGRILNITSRNVTILKQTFENHAKKPVFYNTGILKTVENFVRSVWENDSSTVTDDVSYDIDIKSAGKRISFAYTSKWGHDSEQGQLVRLGQPTLNISVEPYQVVTTKLQAMRIDITFEVEYKSFLTGYLVTNYGLGHEETNFWGLDIEAVMERWNLKNELWAKEVVEATFYTNPKVIIQDMETRDILMEFDC